MLRASGVTMAGGAESQPWVCLGWEAGNKTLLSLGRTSPAHLGE